MQSSKLKYLAIVFVLPLVICFSACGQKQNFDSWNPNTESLNTLKAYVEDVTREGSSNFIPKEDRIVVSDMDGTIYGEKAPLYIDCLVYVHRVLYDNTYTPKDQHMIDLAHRVEECFKTHELDKLTDPVICAEWQIPFAGMSIEDYEKYCSDFLKNPVEGFNNVSYKDFFYKPMLEVIDYLLQNDFQFYIVTGTDRSLSRILLKDKVNIQPVNVLGTDNVIKYSGNDKLDNEYYVYKFNDVAYRTENAIFKDSNTNKVDRIKREIGKQPVLVFGNTSGDESMATYVTSNNKYKTLACFVLQNDNVRDNCSLEKAEKNKANWEKKGWTIFSMKDDWKTIYGGNVEKR
ncbi:MAG: HAD family hydrolase [Coriobacteriia bacterium]|nr:HAD family hydrolase [Coriobacteriia bacterium]